MLDRSMTSDHEGTFLMMKTNLLTATRRGPLIPQEGDSE